MFVDRNFLGRHGACSDGTEWFLNNCPNGEEHKELVELLIGDDKYGWASWVREKVSEELIKTKVGLFKAGDKVRIRRWDDLEKEYGTDSDGDIRTYVWLLRDNKELCGTEFVIEALVDIYDDVNKEEVYNLYVLGLSSSHRISIDMIEKVEEGIIN